MERIYKYTRKVSQNVVNGYCSHLLKSHEIMEEMGVDYSQLNEIENDISSNEFSLMVDHYGRIEDLFRKYKIEYFEQLEEALKSYREKHSRKKKVDNNESSI